jgi:hypothetical protein
LDSGIVPWNILAELILKSVMNKKSGSSLFFNDHFNNSILP